MASATSPRVPCATCREKGVGIFKCEGCGQVFCRKHVIEHRDVLSQQLDEIVLEYDTLQQTMAENKDKPNPHNHPLIKQIEKWERESIEKIRQTANEARQQVNASIGSSGGTMSKDLHELTERLRQARADDDYVETDLGRWAAKLEKLKCDLTSVSPSARICEDSTTIFIPKIYVAVTKDKPTPEERFGEVYRHISIEDNGRIAFQGGRDSSIEYVRGKNEYSKGKHQIQFNMRKRNASFVMAFNIAPTVLAISSSPSDGEYHAYGWYTDDELIIPASDTETKKNFEDLQGETKFELQMLIDCDNRKISYFNERTKNKHEMNVNIQICPFPWRLEFCLFDLGDRVELLSSNQLS